MEAFHSNFTALDWTIVGIYLAATVAIGIYVNRYIATMSDYIVAGRALKSHLSIATMVGTELGLVTVMYAAQTGFTRGLAAMHIGLVAAVATLLVGLTGFIVVPLRAMGVMTIPEFYGRRFGTGTRVFGGLLLAFAGILNMGLFLKAGALFLTALTGLHDPLAVKIVMSLLLGLVLVYTILGGMVSVVITDYLQFVLLSFGMIATCILAWRSVGWERVVQSVAAVQGDAGFNPLDTKGFGGSYIAWQFFLGMASCAIWQTAVMRACAAESTQVVKRLYCWSSIGFLIRFLLPQFLGVCALAWLSTHHVGRELFFKDGKIVDDPLITLQAMPLFLGQVLPVGLIGIVGAAMLAAFMSTHDSYLLCWASVLAHDVVAPLAGERLSMKARLLVARSFIAVIGVFLLVWSLWFPLGQNLWDYMAVTGAIYFAGAFSVLLLGIYWPRASSTGACLALGSGTLALVGLKPVQDFMLGYTPLGRLLEERISSENIGLGVVVLALALMVVGSLLFPDRPSLPADSRSSDGR